MRKAIIGIVTSLLGVPAWAEPITIAALGDSLTQGYGLAVEDGFVAQLQSWADAQGVEVTLINAGVSGDTTAGGLSRAAWTLTPDVDAMIVALGGNDLLRGIDPDVSRANLTGILEAAKTADVKVLLIGMKAPGNYGPEYKARFDAIYPELAAEFGMLYLDDFFTGFGEAVNDPASLRPLMQSDGIHPNPDGVKQIVAGIGPKLIELVGKTAD
jgi:acyl-CoA thioesterase-1